MQEIQQELDTFKKLGDSLSTKFQKYVTLELEKLNKKEAELKEKETLFEHTNKILRAYSPDDKIIFDIGGVTFKTTISTLKKSEPSVFTSIADGRHEIQKNDQGLYVFLDRNPIHFNTLLNYIRSGNIAIPKEFSDQVNLLEEAKFFQIKSVIQMLEKSILEVPSIPSNPFPSDLFSSQKGTSKSSSPLPKSGPFDDTLIINEFQMQQLNRMVDEKGHLKWKLIYRSSRDGRSPEAFHDNCDNAKPTVILVKYSSHIFGGYASEIWNHVEGSYRCDSDAFLFTLSNPSKVAKKIPVSRAHEGHAIFCNRANGPLFGYGCELSLMGNGKDRSNLHQDGYYEDPNPALFTGSTDRFISDEIEVFTLK